MTNIWGFLLQTLSVSLVAVLLLALKRLMEDKLSPRWQYGVWLLLAARLLLPVDVTREVLVSLPLWIEMLKTGAEQLWLGFGLGASAFSGVYAPIRIASGLPWVSGMPASLWDWLFVVYAAGVCVVLVRYLRTYVRLRGLLRQGEPVWPETQAQIDAVCRQYGLRACRAVEVVGLSSAFICGVLRPVLAVPAGQELDDKVLLHELLHLRHWDALQNLGWCVLRALHWCNPFLQYVFDRIGNDMESLCDQRVLERLEGEERREYGRILLGMANEAFARAPGTTSLSNGGKNIARRIEAVVRFKKYPRGMSLVSVCIMIVLVNPLLMGEVQANSFYDYLPSETFEWEQAMAMSRLNRCTTVAGALDTYAKGLIWDNGVFLATASSLDKHEEILEQMRYYAEKENWVRHYLDAGVQLKLAEREYSVYNLVRQEDGSYRAILEIPVQALVNDDGTVWWDDVSEKNVAGVVQIPVAVYQEDSWVVEEIGERKNVRLEAHEYDDVHTRTQALVSYQAETEHGTVTVELRNEYGPRGNAISEEPDLHGTFGRGREGVTVTYQWDTNREGGPQESVGLVAREVEAGAESEWEEWEMTVPSYWTGSGSSSDGWYRIGERVDEAWDGTIWGGYGNGWYDIDADWLELPTCFQIGISWDGKLMEVFSLGR